MRSMTGRTFRVVRAAAASTFLGAALLLSACGEPSVRGNLPPVLGPSPVQPTPEPTPAPVAEIAPEPLPEPVLQPPADDGRIRIALLLPLSGPGAALGRALLDAAVLALFEAGDDRMLLIPGDTAGAAEPARAAAEAALQQGVDLILGPVFSAAVAAAAGPARARGVSMVAFSTDASVAGDGVYLLAFPPQQQVERVVGYAASRGLRRFAALAPETPYGAAVVDALRIAAARNGGGLISQEFYAVGADMTESVRRIANYEARRGRLLERRRTLEAQENFAELRRLAARDTLGGPNYDAVMVAAGGSELRQIASLLPFFDVDPESVRFLGTGLWDDPGLGAEPALVGGWFAVPPPEGAQGFYERFTERFAYRPPRIATLSYDAVALAAALSRGPAPNFGRGALRSAPGFAGTDGIFRFGADGLVQRGLAVLEVREGGPVVIDPAPVAFLLPEG